MHSEGMQSCALFSLALFYCGVNMSYDLAYFKAHRSRVARNPARYRAWLISNLIASDQAIRIKPPVTLPRVLWLERSVIDV
jgi:hypothetical protein